MLADVTLGDGAQQRVGQGVQPGVGVRMPDEPPVMRDPHAAQHHGRSRPEAVGVEAEARPHDPARAGELLRHQEILGPGQFHQHRIAGNQGHAAAGPLHHPRVVRGLLVGRPLGVGRGQAAQAEGLRGLGAPQAVTAHGLGDQAFATLEGVGDGQGGDRAVGVLQRRQQPVHMQPRHEGPGRVVHQHRLAFVAGQRGQARPHGPRPGLAPRHGPPALKARQRILGRGQPVGRHDDNHLCGPGQEQALHRPADHRPGGQEAPGLGLARTGPQAFARRNDNRRKTHGSRL